jgi:DNA replication and repair protein RecF
MTPWFLFGNIMHLTRLSLTNFRNYARLDIAVPQGVVLLVGGNAQGKTSLLEAIYFLATFMSFSATADRQLINFLAGREDLAVSRIVAEYSKTTTGKERIHKVEVRLIQESNGVGNRSRYKKEILIDNVPSKVSEAVGYFNAVLFLPHTMRVIEGAPEDRRRYMNLTLAQVVPDYAAALSAYSRALTQRNALLKQIKEHNSDPSQLTFWDEQLAFSGAKIIHARIHAVQELGHSAAVVHHQLTRGEEVLRLSYEPAFDPLCNPRDQYALPIDAPVDRSGISISDIQAGLYERLEKIRLEEITRGVTTIGPHRDDLRFLSNGLDLGVYGSRGQTRTAVLALKLTEVDWMKDKTGQWPVLLLDEVLAELDTIRRTDLLERLISFDQAILTTTDLDLFDREFVERANTWHIQSGSVLEQVNS